MESTYYCPQRGFSLLEVMVALALLAVGLLGLLALQGHGLEGQQRNAYQTRALQLAADLEARLRANPLGDYAFDTVAAEAPAGPDCHATRCSPAMLADFDRGQWLATVAAALPAAHARLQPLGEHWRLRLRWTPRGDGTQAADDCPPRHCLRRELRR